jgi:hypothetical protein
MSRSRVKVLERHSGVGVDPVADGIGHRLEPHPAAVEEPRPPSQSPRSPGRRLVKADVAVRMYGDPAP